MTAFLDFLSAFAIWIYLAAVVGILFGIKMLMDSRRLSRTTMFTLEQERAGDLAFRAVMIMFFFMLVIGGVSVVNAFARQTLDIPASTPISKQTTPFITPVIFLPTATFTAVPTLEEQPATTAPQPTVAPQQSPAKSVTATRTPRTTATRRPTGAGPTATVQNTPVPATATPAPLTQPPPTQPPPPTKPALIYPAPSLDVPVQNDTKSGNFIQFRWGQGEFPEPLPRGQSYKVTVRYVDRETKQTKAPYLCTQSNSVDTRANWRPLPDEHRGKSVDNKYSWFVIVVQLPNSASDCGAGIPISPPSEVRTFTWQ